MEFSGSHPNELFKAQLLHAVFSNTIVLLLCKKSKSLWLHMIWIITSIYASGQHPNLSFLQPDHSMTSKLWLPGHTLFLLVLIKKKKIKKCNWQLLAFPSHEAELQSYFLRFELSPSPQGSAFLPLDALLRECKVCTCCRRLQSSWSQACCTASAFCLSQPKAAARAWVSSFTTSCKRQTCSSAAHWCSNTTTPCPQHTKNSSNETPVNANVALKMFRAYILYLLG